jgi:hypothetical protein
MCGSTKRRLFLIGAGLAVSLLAPPAVARAEVVRNFGFELKNFKPFGAYTVVYSERSSDTTGAAVPPLTRYVLRFPLGMSIRREVLRKQFLCNLTKLRQMRTRKTCQHAQLGSGKAEADLLDANDKRLLSAPVPADLYFFLAKPTKKGAVASMLILVVPDASAQIVKTIPAIRDSRLVGEASFFNDPTPDGLFGYRLELPPAIAGLRYNALKGDFAFPGLTVTKRVRKCVRSSTATKTAKCRKKKSRTKRIFWITRPKCPSSGRLTFQATYNYAVLPPMTLNRDIPCPEFARSAPASPLA